MQKINPEYLSPQTGRTAIVTGANSGVGFETARALAGLGMQVIMACRSVGSGEEARAHIVKEFPPADPQVMELDLGRLASVRDFSNAFLDTNNRLDLLINNAGIMMPPLALTEDGFESQLAVNYLGHFLLTGLLLPALEATDGSRIVSLSSIAHRNANIDFGNLKGERRYSASAAYGQSKLACLIFALTLQGKLSQAGYQTISVAAHPGVSMTNLGRHLPALVRNVAGSMMSPLFFHAPDKAALPVLMAGLDRQVKGGAYCGPIGFGEMRGSAGLAKISASAKDKAMATRLWEWSERAANVEYSLDKA